MKKNDDVIISKDKTTGIDYFFFSIHVLKEKVPLLFGISEVCL